ncbi:DUF6612 family protein [Cohnella soli]|uniref:DUF6612 family protein n=1 Tax=Cohnella soli TaxID=425005 RepID=A0ABW0HYM2_9BACL
MKKMVCNLAKTGLALAIYVGSVGIGASAVSAAAAKPAATASSAAVVAYDKLFAAFAKVNSYSYKAKSTMTTAGQKTQMTMESDIIMKPKPAFSMKTSFNDGTQNVTQEIISVGNKMYIKTPDGEWVATPGEASNEDQSAGADNIFNKQFKQVIDKTEVKKVGTDQEITITVNPAKYNKLFLAKGEEGSGDAETKKLQMKITVDTKTSLPKKMYMISEMTVMGQTMKTEMTYTYVSYNKVKEIKVPNVSQ